MKLILEIEYHIAAGESICVVGNHPMLGGGDTATAPDMTPTQKAGVQRLEIDLPDHTESITYRYALRRDGMITRDEWGDDRILEFSPDLRSVSVSDHWHDRPSDIPFYSTMFTDCICRRKDLTRPKPIKPSTVTLEVSAAMIPEGFTLAIVGSEPELGAWDPHRAILMNGSRMPQWSVSLPLDPLRGDRAEYKFILINEADGEVAGWEEGSNRILDMSYVADVESLAFRGMHFKNPLPLWCGAGVAIPVFSLRSDSDFGVGDFYDLKLLVDWAAATGQKVIQILPINDTTMTHTWRDCYPYNANSCFALHPMYLRLTEMGRLNDTAEQEQFERTARELNSLDSVDYEKVNKAKNSYTRRLFELYGEQDLASDDFKRFYKANIRWLKPYAAFCTLRDRYNTANYNDWEEWSTFSPSRIDRLMKTERKEFDYTFYIQYHLDRQLRHVRDYAHSKGVALKGDIPIGISRSSVDAWTNPELFNLDCSAGAPPDPFAVLGQNWGFPTYNWDRMALDNFAWWTARLKKMAEYFDAYRIDHVLGFFRIWEIPVREIHGLLGTFNPSLPLSPDEMARRYGFIFNDRWMTSPLINDHSLQAAFGDLTEMVKKRFLRHVGDGRYCLHPEIESQRDAVAAIERSNDLDEKTRQRITTGMLNLLDQVLFIEDRRSPGLYHPRIEGTQTNAFEHLDETSKSAYHTLYEDFYYHRNDSLWREKAMQKLPGIVDATRMLSCAEDLGMIPSCVPSVMDKLKILSLEIQRMPKAFVEFADPSVYPYLSVCSTSTHDMPPLRGWLAQDRDRAERYRKMMSADNASDPTVDYDTAVSLSAVTSHLQSPSMLCILPLQDWLAIDPALRNPDPSAEQINNPADSNHYWRYRMHLTLERLLDSQKFTVTIAQLIAQSNR